MKNRSRRLGRSEVTLLLTLLALTLTFSTPFLPYAHNNPSTLSVPSAQYPTIQTAINAAAPGDTILVSPRTYPENLVITKSINLVGASPNNTIIDASGSGPGINITAASAVYISGFTIKNTGVFDSGILVAYSTNINILGNRVEASKQTNGTYIVNSNSSRVRGNTFTGNLYGVSVIGGFGNLIQGNNATGNPSGDIFILRSSGNKIVDNILRKSLTGLMLWNGAVGNIVARNLIANNTSEGIDIKNSPGAGNLFIENRIEFNRDVTNSAAGVSLNNSTLNRFYHNRILNNSIQVFGVNNPDITSNMWDNATGSPLKTDPKIMFVDTNNNGFWDFNETVVYDANNNGRYDPGELTASANGIPPPPGTPLVPDPKIKFVDTNNDNTWERGEPVAYDSNNENIFEQGEPAISAVGGNFWSDYKGLDNGSHGFTGDGIGDTLIPTPCPTAGRPCSLASPSGVDWYPLMVPWQPSGLNITISASPLGGYPPLQVSFTGSASGGLPSYNYAWTFGDGSAITQQNPIHIYTAKGTYIAILTVTDASSATGSNQVSITVLAPVGNLALQVLDQDLKPIQGANVTMPVTPPGQPLRKALTNNLGIVAFTGLTVGSYLVQASSLGYQTTTKNVTVLLGQTTNERLVLARTTAPNNFPTALLGAAVALALGVLVVFFLLRRRKRPVGQTAKLKLQKARANQARFSHR